MDILKGHMWAHWLHNLCHLGAHQIEDGIKSG